MRRPSAAAGARRALIALLLIMTACGDADITRSTDPPREVVLITHDSFAISEEVWAEFTAQTGFEVSVLRAGDAGLMLNQAILTKDNPLADVLFGVDNAFLSRALAEGIFDPYQPEGAAALDPALAVDDRVIPVDFGDVCLNVDRAALDEPPGSLLDLTRPQYRGLLVVENPATSSPGLAFLMATVAEFGEEGDYTWLDFWQQLRDNEVLVVTGWEEAYYSSFTLYGGDRPLVVSYASSPPAEVIFAEGPTEEAPTAAIPEGCFRQVEYAGILTGAANRAGAEALIDFMLGTVFQEDIPLNMFVFPVNPAAVLPPEFVEFTSIPDAPLSLPPDVIDANRERWISEWTAVMFP